MEDQVSISRKQHLTDLIHEIVKAANRQELLEPFQSWAGPTLKALCQQQYLSDENYEIVRRWLRQMKSQVDENAETLVNEDGKISQHWSTDALFRSIRLFPQRQRWSTQLCTLFDQVRSTAKERGVEKEVMKEWVKEAINTVCTAESRPGDYKADLADQIKGEADFEFVRTTLTALFHKIQKKTEPKSVIALLQRPENQPKKILQNLHERILKPSQAHLSRSINPNTPSPGTVPSGAYTVVSRRDSSA